MSDAPKNIAAPLGIGRYQVTDRLGEGGMGVVYLARDPSLERFVAIKLMRDGFDSTDLRERFVKEARAVASLRHPCIVTLFEYGDHLGQPFIVMEYVNGATLAGLIADGTPMSLARRLQLARDLCHGLEHAHKAGIIHRDIKPANIMVDREGTLKILDFGIAKLGHAGNTQISALVGTPKYMSPEQIAGKPITRRSDIFSVGLVAYELLASRAAFEGESQYVVMQAILNSEPVPLATRVPGLDPRIIRIVEHALEKDPDRRYQELSQMRRDLARICNELALVDPAQSATRLQPPRPPAQLDELARRRAQQIASNLETAERAFELGDYDAALAACEDALIIDPQEERALEGLQRAQMALNERRAFAHLTAARQHFTKDELTLAEEALRAAFELVPALSEGRALQDQVGSARHKKEQRRRALRLALDRAKIRLAEGAFESAIDAANEALDYSPHDSEAQRLKAQALVAFEADQRQREADRRAEVAIDEANRLAARDRYDESLQLLSNDAIASHPLILQARAHIESAQVEFDRLKADAVARNQAARLEAARLEAARLEAVRLEAARLEAVRLEAARLEAARLEAARLEAARLEAARLEAVRLEAARIEARQVERQRDITATVTLPEPRAQSPEPTTPVALVEPSSPAARTWLLAPQDGVMFLPGPIRPRRPRPPRRPVRFLDQEPDRGGAREWFHEQLFVGAKQGHDSVGFGVSIATHLVAVAAVLIVVLTRSVNPLLPPPRTPVTMIALMPPPPNVTVDTPRPPARQNQQVRRDPAKAPQLDQRPVVSQPQVPVAAPIVASSDIRESPTLTLPDTVSVSLPSVSLPPLPGGSIDGMVSEVPVNDYDQEARVIKKVEPKYPAGATGLVRVEVTVLSNGRVSRVKVLDPTPYLDLISEAASQFVFQPAKRRGKPVPVTVQLDFVVNTSK